MKTNCVILRCRPAGRTVSPVVCAFLASLIWLASGHGLQAQPTIIIQPTNYTACAGGTATFCVEAQGTPPLTYQWRLYSTSLIYTNLPGETNACVTLSNLAATGSTPLRPAVVVSDASGSVTSRIASLTVSVASSITRQPADAWAVIGQSFSYSVTATGSPPLYYQWYFNDQLLVGKTTSSLLIASVHLTNAGDYHVVVSNACGTVTSDTARLTAVQDTTFTRITNGTVATDLGSSSAVIGDYNGDGYLDLFIGRYLSGRSALYHNNGDGTFRSITNNNFPLPVGPYFFGPCSDFDNDGRVDLFVWPGANTPSSVYYNNGDGTFASIPMANFDPWYESAVDYDHDGLLDLYFTSSGTGETNRLYRNLGGRIFQPVTSAGVGSILGIRTQGGATWADYDDDGWVDVCVPNPPARHVQLHRNIGNGRFVSVTNQLTRDLTGQSFAVAWADYDNDGRVDLCVAVYNGNSSIYRNLGAGNFELTDIGITIQGTYNGAAWGDYDNDGFLDLFMTYGNNTGNSLFRNNGNGTFTRITNGPVVLDRPTGGDASYAGLWFDYDNDGFLDLFVPIGNDFGTANTTNLFYHNDGNANAWLKVKLVGTVSNREGAGAKVRAKATLAGATRWQRRDITSGGDPYNGSGPIAHFGLGDATNVETLRVEWPSGQVTELDNVAVRQSLTITEAPGLHAIGINQGTMQIQVTAHPGMNIELRATNNLPIDFKTVPYTNWPLWKTVLQSNRTMTVTDPEAGQHPRWFYGGRVQ